MIVQDGIHDRFVAAVEEKAAALRVGDALDPQTQIGPVSSDSQFEQNLRYVEMAVQDGGRLAFGGERLKRIGTEARHELEHLLDAKVFLELWVKVRAGWADDEAHLRSYGY